MPRSQRFHGLARRVGLASQGRRAGLGDAAADTKGWILSALGVPYTGEATTAEELNAVKMILARIANGDLSAYVEGLSFPDSQIRAIALDYLKRAYESSDTSPIVGKNLAFWSSIDPGTFQFIVGHALSDEPWWRRRREDQLIGTLFPILGGGSGAGNGFAGNLSWGFRYDAQPIYAIDFDFAALARAAEAWKASHPRDDYTAPTQEAIDRTQTPTGSSGPPSGWRATTFNGTPGYWAPDGRFYPGDAPWENYVPGTGYSPASDVPAPSAPAPSSSPAGGGPAGGAGGTAIVPVVPWYEGAPVGDDALPAPVMLEDGGTADPDYLRPIDGVIPETVYGPGAGGRERLTNRGAVAGTSSATKWILGGVAAAAGVGVALSLLRGRKRSRS